MYFTSNVPETLCLSLFYMDLAENYPITTRLTKGAKGAKGDNEVGKMKIIAGGYSYQFTDP